MFNFGKFIVLSSFVWFLKANLDNLLVGKILGVAQLGLYAIAFNAANFTTDYFATKVHRVAYPTYSKLQNDIESLRNATLKIIKHVNLVILPFGLMLFSCSGEFLRFVYGSKWLAASEILKILSFIGVFNTLVSCFIGAFLGAGKSKIGFWINLLQVTLFFIFIIPMAKKFGSNGVAAVVVFSSFISFIVIMLLAQRLLVFNFKEIFYCFKPSFFATLAMGIGIIIFKQILLSNLTFSNLQFNLFFLLLLVVSLLTYVLFLYFFENPTAKEIRGLLFR